MEPEMQVCSSSDDASDSEECLTEDEVEEDGCREMILVPKRNARSEARESQLMPEEALGGLGFCSFFINLVSSIATEQLIRRSPRGQIVGELLDHMKHLEHDRITSIAVLLLSELSKCLFAGKRHKLPSLAQAAVWTAFHKLRAKEEILQAWTVFITSNIPVMHHKESELALQILLDRGLKKIISNTVESAKQAPQVSTVRPLTTVESNAIRYMAGYVAVKLLKKYRRCYKSSKVQLKHKLFVRTLQRMKAYEQPGDPDSLSDYSTLWLELIDRGGLYQINDDVFRLIESIEMVVRHYLNVPYIQTSFVPGTNLATAIREKVLSTQSIMDSWERIASEIAPRYEKYSVELIALLTDLWVTIRGNSFAKGWTMNFERKYKKGTRKSLQPEKKT